MNEQEAEQLATEIWERARWQPKAFASAFFSLFPVGLLPAPDTMYFPVTWDGLLEARAWLRQQVASTRSNPGEKAAGEA